MVLLPPSILCFNPCNSTFIAKRIFDQSTTTSVNDVRGEVLKCPVLLIVSVNWHFTSHIIYTCVSTYPDQNFSAQ